MYRNLEPAPVNRSMNLYLHRDLTSGRWYLDQLEIRSGPIHNITRFSKKMTIDQAFATRFVALLKSHFPASLNQQVFSLSGEAVHLDDVVLKGLRVFAQSAADGIQRVIFRFNSVMGRIYEILAPDLRPDAGMIAPVQSHLDADLSMQPEPMGFETHEAPMERYNRSGG